MQIGSTSASLSSAFLTSLNTKLFSALDTDSSGSLTATELSAAGSSSTTATPSAATTLLTRMDSNSDGTVSQSESLAYLQNMLSSQTMGSVIGGAGDGNGPPQPPSLSDIDSNGDGSLSKAEMEAYSAKTTGDTDTTRADKLFSAMDTNGDGTVSADEKTTFDSQMASQGASGHHHHHHMGPPPSDGSATSGTANGTTTTSASTASLAEDSPSLADLMKQFMTALESYASAGASTAATTAATTTLSVSA